MSRLTIDRSGTVRLLDDDGTVVDQVALSVDGQSAHVMQDADDDTTDERGAWLGVLLIGLGVWALIVGLGLILLWLRWSS